MSLVTVRSVLIVVTLLYIVFPGLQVQTLGEKGYKEVDGKVYEVVTGDSCLRNCEYPLEPKFCHFDFEVEWWHTMTEDCLTCPNRTLDCYNKRCATGDGSSRLLRVANKKLPGPSIQVCEGDIVHVRVKNQLGHGNGLAIHWHGIHQRGSQFSDGVPYVTQCYIDYQIAFDYQFVVSPAGTHYWHPHSAMELGDGLGGALIVRRPERFEPNGYLYDEDLEDHYMFVQTIREEIETISYNELMTNFNNLVPASILVNGRAQRVSPDGSYGRYTPLTEYRVTQGKRYRFRMVFAGPSACELRITFDRHSVVVIRTEVEDIQPMRVDVINMISGQRFDIVLDANQDIAKYYIKIEGLDLCEFIEETRSAVIVYEGVDHTDEPLAPVDIQLAEGKPILLNDIGRHAETDKFESVRLSDLRSLDYFNNRQIMGDPDETIYLKFQTIHPDMDSVLKTFFEGNPTRTFINWVSFTDPPNPLSMMNFKDIAKYSCNAESLEKNKIDCSQTLCECTHLYHIPLGSLVEVNMITSFAGVIVHPFHLHGNYFSVLGMGNFDTEVDIEEFKALDRDGKISRNYDRAVRLDNITPPHAGYAVIRFVADNPGWWMFHCHLEYHIEWGMAMVFVVGDEDSLPKPPPGFPQCGDF